jgi:nucleotide-binding universal stress UspA family protein
MVRIVAGIDFEHYPLALSLLERLRFSAAEIHLVHVVESLMPDKSFPDFSPAHPLSVISEEKDRQGDLELVKAGSLLQSTGYHLGTELHRGDPARVLIEAASDLAADIIAVGSAQKSAWAWGHFAIPALTSLFFGSVTKALTANAEQSILIAKSQPRSKDGLAAVLAVDHSAYCDDCIDRFIGWQARGIHRITIVTAPMVVTGSAEKPVDGLDQFNAESEADIHKRNSEICERLRGEGIDCDFKVVLGHPNHAIETVMRDQQADLLILGARGHGFWDRFRLGSVSHHQVVATPHNVIVVRV